jgi:hypothetical protein
MEFPPQRPERCVSRQFHHSPTKWQRGWDSNPRDSRPPRFKLGALSHSATPLYYLPHVFLSYSTRACCRAATNIRRDSPRSNGRCSR